jgi:hypothetical protein
LNEKIGRKEGRTEGRQEGRKDGRMEKANKQTKVRKEGMVD